MAFFDTHAKLLENPFEIGVFIQHYNRQTQQFKAKVDEIKGKHIRMLYRKGRPVAGYVINLAPPFRFLDAIPESERDSIDFFRHFSSENCVEITTLWKDKEHSQLYDRLRLYYMALSDCLFSKRRILLGGALNYKVARIYQTTIPHLLHSGHVNIDGLSKRYWIFYGSTRMLLIRALISTPIVLIAWPMGRLLAGLLRQPFHEFSEFERRFNKS